ncbi:TNT domain-containing protein [Saccharopolyspora pogona]|uniref:TNT domain-containing protein n=1 Tax=Saccharopolyspora pogona TaxID=333966 RepID=UPI001683BEE6|nr:TNT domain-containing protein [Saccharopolyspora pogona]
MSRPTAISPEEQEQIARRIGVLLLQGAPEDWQEITVEYRATGEYHDLLGEVAAQDGSSRPWEPPIELQEIFERLREGMYRPDVGTWLSALYVVERPSSYRIDINFDSEPLWQRPLPRAAYVDELRRYPRAEENVPDWMRERFDGTPVQTSEAPTAEQSTVEPPVTEAPVVEPAAPKLVDAEPAVAQAPIPEPGIAEPADGFQVANVFDDYDEQGRPVVADRQPVPAEEVAALRQYLENAPVVLASREDEEDQLDPERAASVPGTWHTDGAWLWPGATPYYLTQYGVPPEAELVEHIRSRGFQLVEVDDVTRDAAVSELLDQPVDELDDGLDDGLDDEPETSSARPEPIPEPDFDDEPEEERAEPTGGSRHVLDEAVAPDTQEVLVKLHDRLTDHRVDGASYRIGSHSPDARCLIEDGADWVVTAGSYGGEEVRFARVDHAAAYLLGSLLMDRPAIAAAPGPVPVTDLPQRSAPEVPDLPQRSAPEAFDLPQRSAPEVPDLPQRSAPEAFDLPQRSAPEVPDLREAFDLPQRSAPEVPDLPQRSPAEPADLPQRSAPEVPDLPQRSPAEPADLPQRSAPEPELGGANPLFTANQEPAGAPPEPSSQEPAAQAGDYMTRFQSVPRLDRPAQPPAGPTAPPSPPVGQPAQPPVGGPGAPPPLPKRQPRRESGAPVPPGPAQGPAGGAERRPGPGGPGMAGPHRQGPPPGLSRPPQGGQPGQPQAGQPQAGQPQGGQQIQPLSGEPPLTLYRDRRIVMLQPGTELDRFGEPNGNVTYTIRTPYTHRSLPPQWSNRSYFAYRVQRPLQAMRGTAVPWFEQPGGGTAFVLPATISELLADGTLAEMPANDRPPME